MVALDLHSGRNPGGAHRPAFIAIQPGGHRAVGARVHTRPASHRRNRVSPAMAFPNGVWERGAKTPLGGWRRSARHEKSTPQAYLLNLVPKVSAALWEWMREAKLRFGGGRVSMRAAFEFIVRRKGDGVSPRRAFPKRCASFGNESGTKASTTASPASSPRAFCGRYSSKDRAPLRFSRCRGA